MSNNYIQKCNFIEKIKSIGFKDKEFIISGDTNIDGIYSLGLGPRLVIEVWIMDSLGEYQYQLRLIDLFANFDRISHMTESKKITNSASFKSVYKYIRLVGEISIKLREIDYIKFKMKKL